MVCAAALLCSASAAFAAQRYAAPNGAGSACNQYSPCSIETAFSGQSVGDEIVISPGSYGPVSQTLSLSANTYAHGVQGQPAPQIQFAPAHLLSDSGNGSRLSYVRLEGSNVEPLDVDDNSEADQVYAHASAFDACIVYGTLIDSVCWTSATDDTAITGATGGNPPPILRNVTAEATSGTSSNGIELPHGRKRPHHGHGRQPDRPRRREATSRPPRPSRAQRSSTPTTRTSSATTQPAAARTSPRPTSRRPRRSSSMPPVATSAKRRNSPTIDFGATSPLNGPYDFLGKPRTINGLTDIGADEFDPFTGVDLSNQNSKVKKRKVKIAIGCPAGTPTLCSGTLALTYGKKTAGSTSFSLPAGAAAVLKVKISKKAVKKLAKRRKLVTQATATATDGAGTAGTATARVKLKS